MVLWLGHGDAYELLGELVTAEYGLAALPPVEREENGKPFFPSAPGLHFNLSHSGGLALCGAGGAPLGVDVELVRPRRAGLAKYVLSEAEYAWFQQQGGGWGAFYTLWTLKEARVKCTGRGLRQPPPHHRRPPAGAGGGGDAGRAGLPGLFRRKLAGGGLLCPAGDPLRTNC